MKVNQLHADRINLTHRITGNGSTASRIGGVVNSEVTLDVQDRRATAR